MAWSYVRETYGREYENAVGQTRGTRMFLVKSTTDITDISQVQSASAGGTAIPAINDAWPSTGVNVTDLRVVAIEVEEIERETRLYHVRVEYETPSGSEDPDPDPRNREWVVSWGREWVEDVPFQTLLDVRAPSTAWPSVATDYKVVGINASKPVVNSLGRPFNPPYVDRRAVGVCTLEKNLSTATFAASPYSGGNGLAAYLDTINTASIAIAGVTCDQWSALVDEIFWQNRSENGYDFVYFRIVIKYDPLRQITVPHILNADLEYLAGGTAGKTTKFKNKDGTEASQPRPIKENGDAVDEGTDQKIYYAFGTKLATDFSSLNLPTTLPT